MKTYKNHLFIIYTILCEVLSFFSLIRDSSEIENQFALGFSLSRWVLILFVLGCLLLSIYFLYSISLKKGLWGRFIKFIEEPTDELTIGAFSMVIIMSGLFALSIPNNMPNHSILIRLQPITQLFFLIYFGIIIYEIAFLQINPVIKVLDYLDLLEQKIPGLKKFSIGLLIVIISLFYLLNMQDGHDWGGDFSMYIMNANNLVKGLPYAQTGYIYNPDMAMIGPPAYPPVFPLMLTPFIAIWGLNLQILKLPAIICFVVLLVYLNARIVPKKLSFIYRILFLFSIGFYVNFFLISESINSDIPFLLFCYVALHRINTLLGPDAEKKANFLEHILTGVFIYLAYGTRSVGAILIPVALFISILNKKRNLLAIIINLSVPFMLIFIQGLLIPQTGAYFDQLPQSLPEMISVVQTSLNYYYKIFLNIFPLENYFLQSVLFIIMVFGFALGLISHIRKGISSYAIFFFLYLIMMLVWPSYQSWRFLIPIIPIYFLFIIEGMKMVLDLTKFVWLQRTFSILLLVGVVTFYAFTYAEVFPRPLSNIEKKETQELFEVIRSETNSDDVILFFKPRVLALFTQRKSVAMLIPPPVGDTLSRMNELEVSVIVRNRNQEYGIQPELDHFISTHPEKFRLIYENFEYQVFRIRPLVP